MMNNVVLFLQGPLGSFFKALAREFSQHGYVTHKINFNAGDRLFSGADHVKDYRGRPDRWPSFLKEYLIRNKVSAVFLMGDCRYYHRVAKPVCKALGVHFMVFEEGYLRPDTITLEPGGVNALTEMNLSPEMLAGIRPQKCKPKEHIGSTMMLRTWAATAYYWSALLGKKIFPFYRHHRAFHPVTEGAKWIRGFYRKQAYKDRDHDIELQLTGKLSQRFFMVPLQVHDDSQMIWHSNFDSVEQFIGDVMSSFALYAPGETSLVFKHHPMDRGYSHYGRFIESKSRVLGICDRVIFCHDIPLPNLYPHIKGVVTVNSTVGISALLHNVPTKLLGRAFYDIAGLTFQGELDRFWQNPGAVDSLLFNQLHSFLFTQTQINGSFFRRLELTCRNTRLFFECWAKRQEFQVLSSPELPLDISETDSAQQAA